MHRSPIALGFAVVAGVLGCAALAPAAKGQLLAPPAERAARPPPTPEELKRIESIEMTGREIYRQDQIAWRATDALIDKLGQRRLQAEAGGWVITTIDGGALVTFARREPASADDEVLAEIPVLDGKRKPRVDAKVKRALSPTERAMLAASRTALTAVPVRCTERYNTAVLPHGDGSWDVYALAATTQPHVVPMGGHARIHVSADGDKVLDVEPYSKACLMMDMAAERKRSGQEPAFVMSTHLVDDLPAPAHVFLNLSFRKPVLIGTQRQNWAIFEGKIVAMPDKTEPQQAEPKPPADAGTP